MTTTPMPEDHPDEEAGAPPPSTPTAPTPPRRRLYRSRSDSWFGGVAGGLADYFDVDPTLVRIAFVVLAFVTSGIALLGYLIAWIVVPEAPDGTRTAAATSEGDRRDRGVGGALVGGLLLIAVGGFVLLRQLDLDIDWLDWEVVAAAALVVTGLFIVVEARRGLHGGLLTLALILTAALGLTSMTGLNLGVDGAFGDQTVRVTSVSALEDSYSHVFGSLTVDLTNLEVPAGQTVEIEVSVVFGEADVRLPPGVPARLQVNSVFGSVNGPNVDAEGIAASREYEPDGWRTADRRIEVKLSTVFGSGRIR